MVEPPECDEHGSEHMIHEDRGEPEHWVCGKCEMEDEDKELIERLENNRESLDEKIDTIGSVKLRKIIDLGLERID